MRGSLTRETWERLGFTPYEKPREVGGQSASQTPMLSEGIMEKNQSSDRINPKDEALIDRAVVVGFEAGQQHPNLKWTDLQTTERKEILVKAYPGYGDTLKSGGTQTGGFADTGPSNR